MCYLSASVDIVAVVVVVGVKLGLVVDSWEKSVAGKLEICDRLTRDAPEGSWDEVNRRR